MEIKEYTMQHPLWFKVVLLCVMIPIFLLGILGNCAVIAVVARYRKMRTVTNIFITQLALGDLLIVLFCMPFVVPQMYLVGEWRLGKTMCQVVTFFQCSSVYLSIFTLTAMSFERYFVLVHPMKAKAVWTKKCAIKISVVILAVSGVLALPPPLHLHQLRVPLGTNTSEAWRSINSNHTTDMDYVEFCIDAVPSSFVSVYNYCRVAFSYVIPLLTISILYTLIAVHLRSRASKSLSGADSKSYQSRKKVVRMLKAMIVIFALCWLPMHMLLLVEALPQGIEYLSVLVTCYDKLVAFKAILVYLNCISNPILYTFMSSQYRRGFLSLLTYCWAGCRQRKDPLSGSSNNDSSKHLRSSKSTSNTDI